MSNDQQKSVLGALGLYRMYHVKSGFMYSGWYLFAAATPADFGKVELEFHFLPLDVNTSGIVEATPKSLALMVDGAMWQELLETQVEEQVKHLQLHLEQLAREGGHPRREVPAKTEVELKELVRLGFRMQVMPDDDPFREAWGARLMLLKSAAKCPTLQRDLEITLRCAQVERGSEE